MLKIQAQTFRLTLILIVSLCLYWAMNIAQDTQKNQTSDAITDNQAIKPSAFLLDSTFFLYNSRGQASEIHAKKAYFFSNSEFIKIDQPSFSSATSFSSTTNSETRYTLNAIAGDYHPTNESLLLSGNVKAQQITREKLIWTIETEELLLNYKSGLMATDKKVTISQGKHSLTAEGIEASMNDKKLNLLSKVRGKYVFEN